MVTIQLNPRSKAGKALLEMARVMQNNKLKGITIIDDDSELLSKMKENRKNELLSDREKKKFRKELKNL